MARKEMKRKSSHQSGLGGREEDAKGYSSTDMRKPTMKWRFFPSAFLALFVGGAAQSQPAGRIVFSDAPIEFQKEDPESFRAVFGPGEKVFARVYLGAPAEKTVQKVFVDGAELYSDETYTPGDHTTFQVWLMDDDERLKAVQARLADGREHQVRLAIFVRKALAAEGSFAYGTAPPRGATTKPPCEVELRRCEARSAWGPCQEPWVACLLKSKEFAEKCSVPKAKRKDVFFYSLKRPDGDVVQVRCNGGWRQTDAKGGFVETAPITQEDKTKRIRGEYVRRCSTECRATHGRCEMGARSLDAVNKCTKAQEACQSECAREASQLHYAGESSTP